MMDKKNFAPTLYPLNNNIDSTWFIKYRDSSGRIRKIYGRLNYINSKKFRLKEAARMIEHLLEPNKVELIQRHDLISNLNAVLEYRRPELADKSYESYLSYLVNFAVWYRAATKENKSVSPAEYIRYLYVQKYHNNYILRIKIMLGSFFKVLIKNKQYKQNPFADIRVKKIKARSLLPYHKDQVAILKAVMLEQDPQLWDACLFQYYLYFRPKEIRMLRIENILFEEMQVSVGADITKDDDVLLKAIPMPMRPIIDRYRGYPPDWYIFSHYGRPGPVMLSRDHLSKRHRLILDSLNYSHRYAFYSWVHTGVKNAAMSGIPIKQLQLQKGHSDLKMFDEYLKNIGVNDCVQMINQFPEI